MYIYMYIYTSYLFVDHLAYRKLDSFRCKFRSAAKSQRNQRESEVERSRSKSEAKSEALRREAIDEARDIRLGGPRGHRGILGSSLDGSIKGPGGLGGDMRRMTPPARETRSPFLKQLPTNTPYFTYGLPRAPRGIPREPRDRHRRPHGPQRTPGFPLTECAGTIE